MSESEHIEGGVVYATLSEVAAAYGVSVDTVRRPLRRGEIENRKETTLQGFRRLAAMPRHAQTTGERHEVVERQAVAPAASSDVLS